MPVDPNGASAGEGRRFEGWLPSAVVICTGLAAWFSAMAGADHVAVRALSAHVVIAFVATIWWWRAAGKIAQSAPGIVLKLGAFLLLAPDGFATLAQGYADIPAYHDDHLRYFWGMPPAMTLITLAESWALSFALRGRSPRESRLWAKRRLAGSIVAVAFILGSAWWQWRADYYLWRIRSADHGPSRYSLSKVGPKALPSIYREIRNLGTGPEGNYRSNLVSIMVDIRHDQVARRIGTPLVWVVAAALQEPDTEMLAAIEQALLSEPDVEQQAAMTNWIDDLDFNSLAQLTCSVYGKLSAKAQQAWLVGFELPGIAHGKFDPAHRPPGHDPSYPWDDADSAEIDRRQRQMREVLRCLPPVLVGALEAQADTTPSKDQAYLSGRIAEQLDELGPLEPALSHRLIALVARTTHAGLVIALIEELGDALFQADDEAFTDALGKALTQATEGESDLLAYAVINAVEARDEEDEGRRLSRVFCSVFGQTPARTRERLVREIRDRGSIACANTTMMAAYEKRFIELGPGRPRAGDDLWMYAVEETFQRRAADDDRIRPWATRLYEQLSDDAKSGRYLLKRLTLAQHEE